MKYRTEIDGLRALAVIPVILFHAGFELFSGGFIGVDVFFVISGYLITTILIEDIKKERFSIVKFYERRARRILPALLFVMLLCVPFAWMWMLPHQMKEFSLSLVAVSLFASNVFFWKESGYFAAAAEEKPLLHTWSLAVEEQYYFLFPIFLILAWRFGKNRVFWMIVLMAVISLILSEWGWRNKATANFYLAPTRAWELFAGSIAAFIVQKNGVKKNNFLALIGLAAIVFSIFAYDATTPFPSVYALVPVLGGVLLILYAEKETLAAKILSTKALVGIGLISYSTYLWHQPLFAFARVRALVDVSSSTIVFLTFASFVLGLFSWKFVEQPFRNSEYSSKRIFCVSAIFLVGFITVGFIGHKADGFPERFSAEMMTIIAPKESSNPLRSTCRIDTMEKITHINSKCWYGSPEEAEVKILYWGDSHTDTPAYELYNAVPTAAIYHAAYSSCPPILGLERTDTASECHDFNQVIYNFLRQQNFDFIILSARWRLYFTAEKFNNGMGATEDFRVVYDTSKEPKLGDRQSRVIKSTANFVRTLSTEISKSKIIVIGQIPEAGWNVPDYVAKRFLIEGEIPNAVVDRMHVEAANLAVSEAFSAIAETNYIYFEPLDVFCSDVSCRQNIGSNLLYNDDDHLTVYGSKILASELAVTLHLNEEIVRR